MGWSGRDAAALWQVSALGRTRGPKQRVDPIGTREWNFAGSAAASGSCSSSSLHKTKSRSGFCVGVFRSSELLLSRRDLGARFPLPVSLPDFFISSSVPFRTALGNMTAAELWRRENPEATQMWKFLQHVNSKYDLGLKDYPELYRWSVENIGDFWAEVWHFTGVKASEPFHQVRRSLEWSVQAGE